VGIKFDRSDKIWSGWLSEALVGSIAAADEQTKRSFIEIARRAQIIACAIETIATLGYAQASLAQIASRAGISKGVISYHFAGKDELITQIVTDIYTKGGEYMLPRILAETTPDSMLRAYIESNVEFIGNHRLEMVALSEIFLNFRAADGTLRFDAKAEEPILNPLEDLLRRGREEGAFREFAPRPMAMTIRRAIDAIPPQLMADPSLDVAAYARELVTLFDRATRRDP
jgi:AcrR family transcriptional regulator